MDQTHASGMDAVLPRRSWGTDSIELLAVIAIIAILAASALRYYEQALVKSAVTEALMVTQTLRRDVFEFHYRSGRWPKIYELPGSIRSHALGGAKSDIGAYVSTIEIDPDGAMTVTFNDRVAQLAGRHLTLRPVVVPGTDGSVNRWSCSHHLPAPPALALGRDRTDLPDDHLLHLCRQGVQP